MGYSVYIKPTQEQVDLVNEKLTGEWYDDIGWTEKQLDRVQTDIADLAYVADHYEEGPIIGCNYGDHDFAHAVMGTLGKFFKLNLYYYDCDGEICEVRNAPFWKKPKEEMSPMQRRKRFWIRREIKEYDKLLDALIEKLSE